MDRSSSIGSNSFLFTTSSLLDRLFITDGFSPYNWLLFTKIGFVVDGEEARGLVSGTAVSPMLEVRSCGRTLLPNPKVECGTKLLATFCIRIYLGGDPPSLFVGFNFGSGTDRMIF